MNRIGRKIIFDMLTGEIIHDTGEQRGFVRELAIHEYYPEFDVETMDYIELEYGELFNEIINKGSYKVDPSTKQLIIYPKLSISSDKSQINADIVDTATITVLTADDCTVTFKVNEGNNYEIPTINNVATFQFATDIAGIHIIEASNELYGVNVVQVEAI